MSDDLLARVRARLPDSAVTAAELAALVRAESELSGDGDVASAYERVRADLVGLGPLEAALQDPDVTDVLVNAPDDVWIDGRRGLCRTAVRFADDDAVRRLAQRLLATAGRRVDAAHPAADAQLAGGLRLHVLIPPLSRSTVLCLRVLRRRPFALPELLAAGAVAPEMADALTQLVRARLSFVVTGRTGAGKTTMLGTLLGLVPTTERLVVIEDTAEIAHSHPHAVHLQSRAANVEAAGAVTLADLVREALRMRPDRIVLGEARGAEVVHLLAALNTGHAGSASTVHANGLADLVARFEAMGEAAGMASSALSRQLAAGVDVVVHVDRDAGGARAVAAIGVLRMRGNRATVEPALSVVRSGGLLGSEVVRGVGWPVLAERLAP